MKIRTEQCGGVAVVKPEEPLTNANADQVKTVLFDAIKDNLGRIVLDASGVSYVESKGLESLVDATKQLSEAGSVLKLCCVNETVRQVIELTGLWSQFEHFEDANSAVRSFL